MGHPALVAGVARTTKGRLEWGTQHWRKALVFEGYGLQPVRKCFAMNSALAAEGACFVQRVRFQIGSNPRNVLAQERRPSHGRTIEGMLFLVRHLESGLDLNVEE
jgi:hypothetical protein